jgi:hypothetical protein
VIGAYRERNPNLDPAAINVEAMFAAGLNVEMERFLSANPGGEFVAYKHTRPKHIT